MFASTQVLSYVEGLAATNSASPEWHLREPDSMIFVGYAVRTGRPQKTVLTTHTTAVHLL